MADIRLSVTGDTRLLEREIKKSLRSSYSLGGLNTRGFSQPLGKIKGQLGEFEKSLEASNARVIAFGASTSAILAVSTALKGLVTSAIEVEKSLTDINTILGASQANLAKFGNSLFTIANNTGQSFAVVAEAANEFVRQGLGMEQTLARTQDALILTRISGLKAADSVAALTAVMNGFNTAAYKSSEITSKLAAVDAAFAVSSADLAEALRRVGSTAATAGVSLEQLLGIVAATQQITARGGAVIGNSFKTIFTRIQRPRVIDALKELGVETENAAGAQASIMQILTSLARTYDTLAPKQQALAAEMVGGVFQVNVLKAALGDLGKEYSLYANAVKIANNATNEAEIRNKQLNDTISSQLIQTMNNFVKAGAKVGKLTFAPVIGDSLKGINTLLEGFGGNENESKNAGQKIAEGILSGIGAVLKGPGIALLTLGIFKMFERLSKFSGDALVSVLGFNKSGRDAAAIQGQITAHMQKNPQILAAINSGLKTEKDLHTQILGSIRAETQAMVQMDRIAGNIATKMAKSGYKISNTGPTSGSIVPRGGYSSGYVPSLSDKRFEETNARNLGADASVRAKFYPSVKAGGSKGILANSQEEVITPKQFAKQYGVTPKGGESAVIPKYGSIGRKRKAELKRNLEKAHKKSFAQGNIPNFITIQDVQNYIKSTGGSVQRKYSAKKGAKKPQGKKPTASAMLGYMNQNINTLPDSELKTYTNLISQGVILGNMPRGGEGKPSAQTMEKLYALSGGQIGTSLTAGRKKDERIRTPLASADDQGALLPVLGMQQSKLPQVNETTAKFGLSETAIPQFEKRFDSVFHKEYNSMVSRMASQLFTGVKGGREMAKAFSPQQLGADAAGPVRGAVFESFIRGMLPTQGQEVGQAVDIKKGGVRKEFRSLFPEQLRDRPFEVRAGNITREEAAGKMQKSGVSMTLEEVGRFQSGKEESSVEEAINRANRRQGRGLSKPSFADLKGGSLERPVQRMVLDKDFLKQKYNSMEAEKREAFLNAQGVKNVDQLFDKIAASATSSGVSTTLINAAAGAGKTTFALGNKGKQISSLSDLKLGKNLAIVTAREQGENLVAKDYYKDIKRVVHLDVPPEEIKRRRAARDQQILSGESLTGYGREAGSTKYASTDFEAAEARLAEEARGQAGRFKSLKFQEGRYRAKRQEEIKKIEDIPMVMTTGAFTPPTSGHGRIFKEMQRVARETGAMPLAAVSTGTSREGDIGLSKAEKRKLIEMQHPGIGTVGVHGTIPEVIKKDDRLLRAIPSQSTVILGSDRVGDSVGERFRNKGFSVQEIKRDMEGSGMNQEALSATKVRTALSEGRMQDVAGALEPKIAEVLTNPQNVKRLKERADLIKRRDKEFAAFKQSSPVDAELDNAFAQLTNLMVSKGLRKSVQGQITRMYPGITKARQDHPDINNAASQISALRDKKKLQEKELLSKYNTELTRMQMEQQISFADGYVPNFAKPNQAFTPNKVMLNRVIDGDSLNIDFYPASQPRTGSSRLQGFDAFEINKGTPEERRKGQLAKEEMEKYLGKRTNLTRMFRDAGTKEQDRYGRPMFKDDAFGELLVSKGLATRMPERATQGERKKGAKSAIRARRRADGYVPSFALADVFNAARRDMGEDWSWEKESGIKNALAREESFGKKGRVLFSNRLQQPVVVNESQIKKYGKSADKIISKDHIERGQGNSISNLGKTGSGKEQYSDGYVPNFVFDAMGLGMLGMVAQGETMQKAFNPVVGQMEKMAEKSAKLGTSLQRADTAIELVTQEIQQLEAAGKGGSGLKGEVKESFDRYRKQNMGRHGAGYSSTEEAFQGFKQSKIERLSQVEGRRGKIVSGIKDVGAEEEKLREKSDRQEKVRGVASGVSMAGGFALSSIAGSLSDQSTKTAQTLSGLGDAANMASTAMFMLPGPAGLVAGGLIGATKAITGLHSAFTNIGPQLTKAADQSREKFQKLSDSTQKYATIFQKLQGAYADSGTSIETLTRLEDQMASAIADLPEKYRAEMIAVSNLTDMQSKLAKILDEEGKKMQQKQLAADLGKRIDDANDLIFDDDLFKNTKLGREARATEAKGIVKQVGEEDLAALARAAGGSAKEFQKHVESLASVTPELRQALQGFVDSSSVGDYKENLKALEEQAKARRRDLDLAKQSTRVQSQTIAAEQRRNRELQQATDFLNASAKALADFARGAAGRVDSADRLRGEQRASNVRVRINEAKNVANRMSKFTGPETIAQVQDRVQFAELENRQQLERNNALINARGSAGDQILKAVEGVEARVGKEGLSPGGKSGRGVNSVQQQEAQLKFIRKLGQLQLQLRADGADFEKITSEMQNLLKAEGDKGMDAVLNPVEIQKLQNAISQGNDKIVEKLANLNRTQLEEKKIMAQNMKARAQDRLDRKDLAMGGGITAFLDPKGFQAIADEFQAGFQLMATSRGSSITTGRGAVKVASSVQKFMGGSIDSDSPAFDRLRSQGVQGIAANMKLNRDKMVGVARRRGDEELARALEEMSDEDFARAATKQFDHLIKMEKGVASNLVDANTTLQQILAEIKKQGGDSKSTIADAAEKAMKPTAQSEQERMRQYGDEVDRARADKEMKGTRVAAQSDAVAAIRQGYMAIGQYDTSTAVNKNFGDKQIQEIERVSKEGASSAEISDLTDKAFRELRRNLNDSITATQGRLNQAKKDKDLRGADKEQRNLDNLIRTRESLFKAPRKDPKTGEILEEGGSAGKARKGLRQAIEMENKIKKGEIASTRPANVRPVGGGGQSVQGIPSAQQTPQASSGGIAGQASPQPMQVQMPDISQMSGEDCCSKLTALIRLTEKGNQLLSAHPKGTGAAGTGAGSNDETIHLNKRPPDQRFERRDKKPFTAGTSPIVSTAMGLTPKAPEMATAISAVKNRATQRLNARSMSQRIAGQTAGGNERIGADGTIREAIGKRFRSTKFAQRMRGHQSMGRNVVNSALRAGGSEVMERLRGAGPMARRGIESARQSVEGLANRFGNLRIPRLGDRTISQRIAGQTAGGNERIAADGTIREAIGKRFRSTKFAQRMRGHQSMGRNVVNSALRAGASGVMDRLRGTTMPSMQGVRDAAVRGYDRAGSAMSRGIQGARTGLADFRTGFATGSPTSAINEGQMGSRVHTSRMQRFGAGIRNIRQSVGSSLQGARTSLADFRTGLTTGSGTVRGGVPGFHHGEVMGSNAQQRGARLNRFGQRTVNAMKNVPQNLLRMPGRAIDFVKGGGIRRGISSATDTVKRLGTNVQQGYRDFRTGMKIGGGAPSTMGDPRTASRMQRLGGALKAPTDTLSKTFKPNTAIGATSRVGLAMGAGYLSGKLAEKAYESEGTIGEFARMGKNVRGKDGIERRIYGGAEAIQDAGTIVGGGLALSGVAGGFGAAAAPIAIAAGGNVARNAMLAYGGEGSAMDVGGANVRLAANIGAGFKAGGVPGAVIGAAAGTGQTLAEVIDRNAEMAEIRDTAKINLEGRASYERFQGKRKERQMREAGGDEAVFATFERLKSEYTAATSEAEASRAENIGLGKELFGWLPGVEDAGAITSEAAKNLEEATDALRQEAERITGQSISKDKSSGEIMNIVSAFKEAGKEQKLQARVKAEKQKKEKQSEILRSDEYARFHGGAFSLQDSANFATERGQGLIANILTQLLKCCREDDSMMGIQQAVDSLKEPMARIPEGVKDGAKDGVSGTAKETSKGAKEGAKEGTESAAPAVESASESGAKKGSESGSKKGTKEGVQQSGIRERAPVNFGGRNQESRMIAQSIDDASRAYKEAIERNSGQRFNEGIMAKPPMSADDMVVGPTAMSTFLANPDTTKRPKQYLRGIEGDRRIDVPEGFDAYAMPKPKRPKKPPVGTTGEAASGTMPGTRPTTASNTGLMSAFDPSKQSARISRAPRPPQSSTMPPRQVDPKPVKETPSGITGLRIGGKTFSTGSSMMNNDPAVVKNLEEAQKNLHEAKKAFINLSMEAQKTGTSISDQQALSAAANVTSAQRKADQALIDHMDYFSPEKRRESINRKYNIQDAGSSGQVPQGMVTPIFNSGVNAMSNIPSRSETIRSILSQQMPEGPSLPGGMDGGNNEIKRGIEGIVQGASKEATQQERMIGVLKDIRDRLPTANERETHNRPLPSSSSGPAGDLLPADPNIFSGTVPNFSTKQAGIKLEESLAGSIPGYGKVKGRYDKKVGAFVNNKEFVASQSDLMAMGLNADGPLVMPPQSTTVGRERMQELKQQLAFSGKVPNFGYPASYYEARDREARVRDHSLSPSRPPAQPQHAPGHVNMGGKQVPIDDKWITHAHQKGMELQSQGKTAEAAWWFARRNGLGKLKYPGTRYGSSDAKTVERQLNQAQLTAHRGGLDEKNRLENFGMGPEQIRRNIEAGHEMGGVVDGKTIPGKVNVGGKLHEVKDSMIKHAHEMGMKLSKAGRSEDAAWWFARRNGLGNLKYPGKYGTNDPNRLANLMRKQIKGHFEGTIPNFQQKRDIEEVIKEMTLKHEKDAERLALLTSGKPSTKATKEKEEKSKSEKAKTLKSLNKISHALPKAAMAGVGAVTLSDVTKTNLMGDTINALIRQTGAAKNVIESGVDAVTSRKADTNLRLQQQYLEQTMPKHVVPGQKVTTDVLEVVNKDRGGIDSIEGVKKGQIGGLFNPNPGHSGETRPIGVFHNTEALSGKSSDWANQLHRRALKDLNRSNLSSQIQGFFANPNDVNPLMGRRYGGSTLKNYYEHAFKETIATHAHEGRHARMNEGFERQFNDPRGRGYDHFFENWETDTYFEKLESQAAYNAKRRAKGEYEKTTFNYDWERLSPDVQAEAQKIIDKRLRGGSALYDAKNVGTFYAESNAIVSEVMARKQVDLDADRYIQNYEKGLEVRKNLTNFSAAVDNSPLLKKVKDLKGGKAVQALNAADDVVRHGSSAVKGTQLSRAVSTGSKTVAAVGAPGADVLAASLQSASAFNALNAQQQKLALEQMGIDINNPEAVSSMDMFGYTLKEFASPLWRDSVTMQKSYDQMAGTGEQGFARQFFGKKGQKAWDAFNKASASELVSGKAHNLTGNKTVDSLAQFGLDSYAMQVDIAKDMGSQAIGMVGGIGQLGVAGVKGGAKGVSKGHNWITDKLSTPLSWLYNQGNVPNLQKELDSAIIRETNGLMDVYGLSREKALSHVKLGQDSSIKANSEGKFVWNNFEFANAKKDLASSRNNRNLIGATGSVPNFQSAAEAQALRGITTGKGSDGGAVDRIVSGLKEIRYAIISESRRASMPTATVSENPQTFNEINIQQSFNNLIDSLKSGIEDIVTSISENNETNNQILDIGPVKIDESSINALTEQFGASMEAQISRLIDVVREVATTMGEGASVAEIMGTIQHKLSVTHGGNLNVNADEAVKQIWPRVQSYVEQSLNRQQQGGEINPTPPINTGTGTQTP